MFIKTRIEACIKGRIELAVFVAFGEVLVEALSFGLGVAELVLVNGISFIHTVVYDAYKQTHNQEKQIKFLSLSSNWK